MFTFTPSKKTVGHINSNRNTIKDIPQVGLCLLTDFWLLALKAFTYLRKSHLAKPSSIAEVNTERSYANLILQESMDRIIDVFGKTKKAIIFSFLNTWTLDTICTCFLIDLLYCVKKIHCVLILSKQHVLFGCNRVM